MFYNHKILKITVKKEYLRTERDAFLNSNVKVPLEGQAQNLVTHDMSERGVEDPKSYHNEKGRSHTM